MDTLQSKEQYDLLIITDATFSMNYYLTALNTSLPQIISVSALTDCFSRIGLLAYRDHCDSALIEWSGWLQLSSDADTDQPDLLALARSLEAEGGGDYPEAVKTALAKAYERMRPEVKTVILLYTDAPPHANVNRNEAFQGVPNHEKEIRHLSDPTSYGGFGPRFVDWVSACKELRGPEKQAQVFCILQPDMAEEYTGHYHYLCTMTGGSCIRLKSSRPSNISKVTMELLLAWMGIDQTGASGKTNNDIGAKLSRYIDVRGIKNVKSEDDKEASSFFTTPFSGIKDSGKQIQHNVTKTPLTIDSLKKYLPKKVTPVSDFAESWSKSLAYQALAVRHLKKIIDNDVRAIAINPVFGKLWRAICNDRTNEARLELVGKFSSQLEKVTDPEERAFLKAWVEESYDFTPEILSIINSVPKQERFPCVFLDPTLRFTYPTADLSSDEDDINRPITALSRAELLEIGRSCDPRILTRLGKVLTQLTYVHTAADLPEHIAVMSDEDVTKIPMALARNEHECQFWRVLLHLVVPGTKLSMRPAALLAALSLRLGIKPLTDAAEEEMLNYRGKWNDSEVPENWTVSCLSLLLDADQAYSQDMQRRNSVTECGNTTKRPTSLLKQSDRALFDHLVAYKVLESNLESILTARVGWTPQKTTAPIGPLIICRSCQYPRSVTVMGNNKQCGVCLSTEPRDLERWLGIRVSMEDNEQTQAMWVECCVRTCRAQYVVYRIDDLNVRAKCHYCRNQGSNSSTRRSKSLAPLVECSKCLNRMIWPEAYRSSSSFTMSGFVCPPCTSGQDTIVATETTAKKISDENTLSWLIQDTENPDTNPFTKRSLYHTISTMGTNTFTSRIELFPPTNKPLTLKGKEIHNHPDLISTLQSLISRRQTEKRGCSLCFSTLHPSSLNPACGRRGCLQRLCTKCLSRWYGLNESGRIINTGALSCPFCRRYPSARTLAKYGMGIHAVRNLADAVRDRGTWIYGWCNTCSSAMPFMERVCTREESPELNNWSCERCHEERRLEAKRIAHEIQDREQREAMLQRIREGAEAAILRRTKTCPGCGIQTEKISGCGHITCQIPGCKTDWCFFCKKKMSENDISKHMRAQHGGLYDYEEEEIFDDLVLD